MGDVDWQQRALVAERERDEANERAAVLGEALTICREELAESIDHEGRKASFKAAIAKADTALTSLPASAKALVRTPGTVEVCERHGYTMECADYVGREERPKFCSAAKCPLRSQQGKVNT